MESTDIVVLVVEDEFFIGQMVQEALEDGGYVVVVATNGSKGWALLEENGHDFSAVVTDIRAGEGPNGWEIARHARHLKPEIAVAYVTGDSASDWTAEGVPNSLLLQKPFTPSQIVTAVSTLLNVGPPTGLDS